MLKQMKLDALKKAEEAEIKEENDITRNNN